MALVNAAKYFGINFIGRDEKNNMVVRMFQEEKKFELLNVIEFSSQRKRMTVIVRTPENKILVMCKGADSVLV